MTSKVNELVCRCRNVVFTSLRCTSFECSLDLTIEEIQLTLYIELYGGVGHPHHVLCNAGQLKVVVISADVGKSQVDGVDVWPVYI